jgi:hypothetical protein
MEARASAKAPELLWLWLVLAGLGTVLPLSQFLPWLAEHGLEPVRFLRELFSTAAFSGGT